MCGTTHQSYIYHIFPLMVELTTVIGLMLRRRRVYHQSIFVLSIPWDLYRPVLDGSATGLDGNDFRNMSRRQLKLWQWNSVINSWKLSVKRAAEQVSHYVHLSTYYCTTCIGRNNRIYIKLYSSLTTMKY